MGQPNPSTALARVVIDELARGGVRLAVVSPGSRSAALAIAASSHEAITTVVSIDERSAGFHALGWAKATGAPAALICTSGTAPANYLPAVVEASMSLASLVVVSADRPDELRGVGANQTIDQTELYGAHVRLFSQIGAPDASSDANLAWRSTVSGIVAAARGALGKPGPAHLNVAFREPTVPVTDDGRTVGEIYPFDVSGSEHRIRDRTPPTAALEVAEGACGVVIAGEGRYDRARLRSAASRLGWPVLATALSGLRGDADVVTAYHHLLAGGVPDRLRPSVVYAVGSLSPSDRLEALVASGDQRIRIDYWGRHIDPARNATNVIHADPAATLEALADAPRCGPEWARRWEAADQSVIAAIDEHLGPNAASSGAAVASALNLAGWEVLVAASSLPIREVDAHIRRRGTVIANRGASGIDGFVSTALGVARSAHGTVALAGDLSLLHDSNGFLIDPRPDMVVVVIDNGGGGLFDSLPTAAHAPDYERLFVTPHHRDLAALSAFHRLNYREADNARDVIASVDDGLATSGVSLIRVAVDRSDDLATRRKLDRIGSDLASRL
ncbi:MAG: 2-succinyl-5-enolpyruvyl-6-hydroxy-3-cyclohexene-1-carboxylic-acid synthase [Acidimicrobiia bacterium]|nr:2-succinyl-5-enolpyruvyl-6-hydroxy-3-cyclohexene-1-carboxylic-acid synthase [Acidimicrobiia bacterium]